jgi:hypothetical protein
MHLLVLAAVLSSTGAPSASFAAVAYIRGDVSSARSETSAVLTKTPGDAAALFVRACIELETLGPPAAEPYVASLERLSPRPSEPAVLRRLLSRRSANAREPIQEALVEAWKSAGNPDLSDNGLLGDLDAAIPALARAVVAKMTAPERLLFAYSANAERFTLAVAAAEHPELNPLVVNLNILEAVAPCEPLPLERREEAKRVAARVGDIVRSVDPANGYLSFAAWLGSGSGDSAITAAELAALETGVVKPRFEVPRRELHEQLRVLARRFDPADGDLRARSAAMGIPVPLYRLWQRADATQDPVLRKRAGALLTSTAKRLACSGTMLERMLGMSLAARGAALTGNEAERSAIRAMHERFQHTMKQMTDGQKKLGIWPFASPWREWDADLEMEHFARFVDSAPTDDHPALRCSERPRPSRTWAEPGAGFVRDFHRRSGITFSPCSDAACLKNAYSARRPAHRFEANFTIEGTPVFTDLFVAPAAKGVTVIEFFDASRDEYGGCRISRLRCPSVEAAISDRLDTLGCVSEVLYQSKPCKEH